MHKKQFIRPLLVFAVMAVVGGALVLFARADTMYAASELENGQLTAGSSRVSDPVASGGQAVRFGGYDILARDPYAANNVWYTALPASTPIDTNSSAIVKNIQEQSVQYYNTFGINTTDYTPPFFVADASTPKQDVSFWDCQNKGFADPGFVEQLKNVPIPSLAKPAGGTDSEMVIYQPSSNTMWELWQAQKVNGSWQACWGGRMQNMNTNRGFFANPYGTTATGLPFLGSTAMVSELQSGVIDHALAFAAVDVRQDSFSWPASRTDGGSADPATPVEGQRFRLDPSLNIDSLSMTPAGKTFAKAIQKYGMILRDRSGSVNLYAENATPYIDAGKADPYGVIFGSTPTYEVMNGFPWDRLQALPVNYGQ